MRSPFARMVTMAMALWDGGMMGCAAFVLTLNDSPHPFWMEAPCPASPQLSLWISVMKATPEWHGFSEAIFPSSLLHRRCPRKTVPKPKSGEILEGDKGFGGRGSLPH